MQDEWSEAQPNPQWPLSMATAGLKCKMPIAQIFISSRLYYGQKKGQAEKPLVP